MPMMLRAAERMSSDFHFSCGGRSCPFTCVRSCPSSGSWSGVLALVAGGRQVGAELAEKPPGAFLAALDAVQAVEVDALLGVGQVGLTAVGLQRDRGQGGGPVLTVGPHVVG